MTRRTFLKKSLGGGALFAVAGQAAAQTSPSLSLASADVATADALASSIDAVTAGGLAIDPTEVTASDSAGLLDRVAGGGLDLAVLPLRHLIGRSPAFAMFDSMPFGMSSGEVDGWLSASDGAEMLGMLTEGTGVSVRLVSDGGALPLWAKAPVVEGVDMRGLAVGARGLGIRCLRAAGVASVADLDDPSTDWRGLDVIEGASVLEMRDRDLTGTFPNVARVNPVSPTSFTALIANDAALEALSPSHRDLLETACAARLALSRSRAFHENTAALLDAGGAVGRFDLGEDTWRLLRAGSQAVLEEIFGAGDREAAIVDAYVYFITDIAPWSEVGEAAYYSGRKRVLTGL